MPKTPEQINQEKRQEIINTLQWFNLVLSPLDVKKLETDQNISLSSYLDGYLQPCISTLYRNKNESFPFINKESIQFRGLISLCFKGDVSQKTWDVVWAHLTEEDKIFYTTTYFYLGYPLEIAVNSGNIDAIKRLNTIYENLLLKHPERKFSMHLQLREALRRSQVKSENEQRCFDMLLEFCDRYAEIIDSQDTKNRFSNKQLVFKYSSSGLYVGPGSTTLLDLFSDICKELVSNHNIVSLKHIYSYLTTNGITREEFIFFNSKVRIELEVSIHPNDNFYKATVEILEPAERLFDTPYTNEMQPFFISNQDLTPIRHDGVENSLAGSQTKSSTIETSASSFFNPSSSSIPNNKAINHSASTSSFSTSSSSSTSFFSKDQPILLKTSNNEVSNHNKSSLTPEHIVQVTKLIKILDDEIKSYWPYPNKKRKEEKARGLRRLLDLAKFMDVDKAIKKIEQQFKEDIRKGDISMRTADLLDSIRDSKNTFKRC